jgi:hypothetical protein
MNRIPLYVGLDYHQDSVQVCVVDHQSRVRLNRRCGNDWREIAAAVEPLGGAVTRAGIECCTGAADLAEELATHARWPVDLAHPGYVARLKQTPDKSDFSDARLLADLERTGYLPRVWLPPREVRQLRTVLRFRQQLVDRRRDTKLRIGALLRQQRVVAAGIGKRWSKPWMTWLSRTDQFDDAARWVIDQHLLDLAELTRRIGSAEAQLQRMTAHDPLVKKLMNVKGIGGSDRLVAARGGRTLRPLQKRQAAVALLRPEPLQPLQRHACRRQRAGVGRTPATQGGADRSGPPAGAVPPALARAVRTAVRRGQTQVRRVGGGRQPLGAFAAARDEITAA